MIRKQTKTQRRKKIILNCLRARTFEEIDITIEMIETVKDLAPNFLKEILVYKANHFEIKPDALNYAINNNIISLDETDLHDIEINKEYNTVYGRSDDITDCMIGIKNL